MHLSFRRNLRLRRSRSRSYQQTTEPAGNGLRLDPIAEPPSPSRFMKLERSASHPAAHLNPKTTPDREAQRNARIIKRRGNWGGGQKRWQKWEPETQGNETKPDKEREEDKFTPMGDGGDDDDEGVERAAFQGSGSSHHLAAAESESNNRLSRDS